MAQALSTLYGWLTQRRAELYRAGWLKKVRLPGPTVSVGNLSLGGTGKTPIAALLAQILLDEGRQPVLLSRGYKGRAENGNLLVSDGTKLLCSPRQCGDEPFLLARTLPGALVAVGRRRERSAQLTLPYCRNPVFILDDGFQHLRIKRDLDLLVIEGQAAWETDRPLPAGRLREPLAAARRADWILVSRSHRIDDRQSVRRSLQTLHPQATLFFLSHRPVAALNVGDGLLHQLDEFRGREAVALAGIGRPKQFLRDLEDCGLNLIEQRLFPDHHWFTQSQIDEVLQTARQRQAVVFTTEKDAVRLEGLDLKAAPLFALRIEALAEESAPFRKAFLEALPRPAVQASRRPIE